MKPNALRHFRIADDLTFSMQIIRCRPTSTLSNQASGPTLYEYTPSAIEFLSYPSSQILQDSAGTSPLSRPRPPYN